MPFKVNQATFDPIQKHASVVLYRAEDNAMFNMNFPIQMDNADTIEKIEETALKEIERLFPIALEDVRKGLPTP